ncbi:hypothetical protein BJ742DRAFT_819587 [Cladochytrium replicatum]|nr:hypothetical protein BJ742DRAFT_819587 [Cladochytrium replicatum]
MNAMLVLNDSTNANIVSGNNSSSKTQSVFVSKVLAFSSQYGVDGSWAAVNVAGKQRIYPHYGDDSRSWAPRVSNSSSEHLVVTLEKPMKISKIEVFETYNPGALVRISCFPEPENMSEDSDDDESSDRMDVTEISGFDPELDVTWVSKPNQQAADLLKEKVPPLASFLELWRGKIEEDVPLESRINEIVPTRSDIFTRILRFEMDCSKCVSWYEIDAIRFTGDLKQSVEDTAKQNMRLPPSLSSMRFGLWVDTVIDFSSEHSEHSWGAHLLVGPPRYYPSFGDSTDTWCVKHMKSGAEHLTLLFAHPLVIEEVILLETVGFGRLVRVSAVSEHLEPTALFYLEQRTGSARYTIPPDLFVELWHGPTQQIANITTARIFSPPLMRKDVCSRIIKLEFDTSESSQWLEIDAVQIRGQIETNSMNSIGLFDPVTMRRSFLNRFRKLSRTANRVQPPRPPNREVSRDVVRTSARLNAAASAASTSVPVSERIQRLIEELADVSSKPLFLGSKLDQGQFQWVQDDSMDYVLRDAETMEDAVFVVLGVILDDGEVATGYSEEVAPTIGVGSHLYAKEYGQRLQAIFAAAAENIDAIFTRADCPFPYRASLTPGSCLFGHNLRLSRKLITAGDPSYAHVYPIELSEMLNASLSPQPRPLDSAGVYIPRNWDPPIVLHQSNPVHPVFWPIVLKPGSIVKIGCTFLSRPPPRITPQQTAAPSSCQVARLEFLELVCEGFTPPSVEQRQNARKRQNAEDLIASMTRVRKGTGSATVGEEKFVDVGNEGDQQNQKRRRRTGEVDLDFEMDLKDSME